MQTKNILTKQIGPPHVAGADYNALYKTFGGAIFQLSQRTRNSPTNRHPETQYFRQSVL